MGYSTEFTGSFKFNRPLTEEQTKYIQMFAGTRRMKRDPQKLLSMADPVRLSVGLGLGDEGGYYVGAGGFLGQKEDESILDYNNPPKHQPGLWCNWTTDGKELYWNGSEKFYHYIEWLDYLIVDFFVQWDVKLNGEVEWQGDDEDDSGTITIIDNVVSW